MRTRCNWCESIDVGAGEEGVLHAVTSIELVAAHSDINTDRKTPLRRSEV